VVTLDLSNNVWSATLNGSSLVPPTQMVDANVDLSVGFVDVGWFIDDITGKFGDNRLTFDNLLVTSGTATLSPPPQPSLGVRSILAANGGAIVHLSGPDGYRFAVDATTNLTTGTDWVAVGTNAVSGGQFDLTDPTPGLPWRFYRARWVP
jgi:hypothetical protein